MTWKLTNHPAETFERNTLASVILQLRFKPILKVEARIADFQDKVRIRFPGFSSFESQEVIIGGGKLFSPQLNVRNEKMHQFVSHDELAVMQLGTSALSIQYMQHKSKETLLSDTALFIDALNAVYAPVSPIRLGLRYVNLIQREVLEEELQRPLLWSDVLSAKFAEVPGGAAALDASTRFFAEVSSPCDKGSITMRHGLLSNLPGEAPHFRLDIDRYLEGAFSLEGMPLLLKEFSSNVFCMFMTAAGPALLEWMRRPERKET